MDWLAPTARQPAAWHRRSGCTTARTGFRGSRRSQRRVHGHQRSVAWRRCPPPEALLSALLLLLCERGCAPQASKAWQGAIWIGASTASRWVDSCICPAVTVAVSGMPCVSVTRWILVLTPPTDRPKAWSSGSAKRIRPLFLARRRPPAAHE